MRTGRAARPPRGQVPRWPGARVHRRGGVSRAGRPPAGRRLWATKDRYGTRRPRWRGGAGPVRGPGLAAACWVSSPSTAVKALWYVWQPVPRRGRLPATRTERRGNPARGQGGGLAGPLPPGRARAAPWRAGPAGDRTARCGKRASVFGGRARPRLVEADAVRGTRRGAASAATWLAGRRHGWARRSRVRPRLPSRRRRPGPSPEWLARWLDLERGRPERFVARPVLAVRPGRLARFRRHGSFDGAVRAVAPRRFSRSDPGGAAARLDDARRPSTGSSARRRPAARPTRGGLAQRPAEPGQAATGLPTRRPPSSFRGPHSRLPFFLVR